MKECTRFENEGIAKLESGASLDKHFYECQTCIEERRKYERLISIIAHSSESAIPREDWEQEVLAKIRVSESFDNSGTRKWYGAIAACVAVIAMFTVWLLTPSTHSVLELELHNSETSYRGEMAKPGDLLSVSALTANDYSTQLRIYRDQRLYLNCDIAASCKREGDKLLVTINLNAMGEYQAILIYNSSPINFDSNILDADVLLARENHAEVHLSKVTIVR